MTVLRFSIFVLCALSAQATPNLLTREVFGDPGRMAWLDSVSEISACVLTMRDPSHGKNLRDRTFVEGRYQRLGSELATLIKWKLLNESSYLFTEVPGCILTWNARVRFESKDRTLDADFCFSCKVVRIMEDGKIIGGAYFKDGSDWVYFALATKFGSSSVFKHLEKERRYHEQVLLEIEIAKALEAKGQKANQPVETTPVSAPH